MVSPKRKTKERDKRQDGTLSVGAENCVRGQECAAKKTIMGRKRCH
jgi:hypothetical protein